ncbi:MAG TPA: DNA repair protein RecO [Coriobacteriia bacterium]|nr:DNA repair protein RecO [Coriobacteriia bacterium]
MDDSTTLIVLKKTKLGETDLIINGFSEQGFQIRAVAKGARKPGSKLGVHLELYSQTRVLVSKGRSLGIITEAQTVRSNESCRSDVLHSAGAAAIVELLDKISADSVADARLFALVCEALRSIGDVSDGSVRMITAAALLKIASQSGVRPSLKECVFCGDTMASQLRGNAQVAFSCSQGGVICDCCLSEIVEQGYTQIDPQLVEWAEVLITGRFKDLERHELLCNGEELCDDLGQILLEWTREWIRFHLVSRLKSLDFLLSFR